MAGNSTVNHSRTRHATCSVARRTGRWGVRPSDRNSRPTDARLNVTPYCRSISSRTIARVQSANSNCNCNGLFCVTVRYTHARCCSVSLGGRPGIGSDRNAARPPVRYLASQL